MPGFIQFIRKQGVVGLAVGFIPGGAVVAAVVYYTCKGLHLDRVGERA